MEFFTAMEAHWLKIIAAISASLGLFCWMMAITVKFPIKNVNLDNLLSLKAAYQWSGAAGLLSAIALSSIALLQFG